MKSKSNSQIMSLT